MLKRYLEILEGDVKLRNLTRKARHITNEAFKKSVDALFQDKLRHSARAQQPKKAEKQEKLASARRVAATTAEMSTQTYEVFEEQPAAGLRIRHDKFSEDLSLIGEYYWLKQQHARLQQEYEGQRRAAPKNPQIDEELLAQLQAEDRHRKILKEQEEEIASLELALKENQRAYERLKQEIAEEQAEMQRQLHFD